MEINMIENQESINNNVDNKEDQVLLEGPALTNEPEEEIDPFADLSDYPEGYQGNGFMPDKEEEAPVDNPQTVDENPQPSKVEEKKEELTVVVVDDTENPGPVFTYVHKNTSRIYYKMNKLNNSYNVGTTYKDFLDGKWVKLSDKQVQFHLDNPNASVQEVLNMELKAVPQPSEEDLINKAKSSKLGKLVAYDNSSEVNEFSINGETKAWFTPEQRANYKNSIDSAKLLGIDTL